MDCPDCKTDGIYIKMEDLKKEYFCPNCKLYFIIKVDPDSIEFEEHEFDDSEYSYEA